jgi:methylmalonyl-CoA/ethylmalonyl-CoA epimerase
MFPASADMLDLNDIQPMVIIDHDWRRVRVVCSQLAVEIRTGTQPVMGSIALTWSPRGSLHHIGYVVDSIEQKVQSFSDALQSEWDGHVVHDPNQHVRVTFLQSKNPVDPLFELVEPAGEKSPVLSFLRKGGGLHHICYVVDSLESALAQCRSRGMLVVRTPVPAAAFGGRRIAWVYTRDRLLIEYLES